MLTTSASLLGRIQQADDPRAWERFVRTYSPVLYSWGMRMGLQNADALDLVQEVFAILVKKLPEFSYDAERGFRNWLFIVTRNKCLEKAARKPLPVDRWKAPNDVGVAESDAVERADFHRHLMERVLPSMSKHFQASTWRAFYAHVVEGEPAAKVAGRLKITVSAVFKAKARVLARLHRELADIMTE